MIVLDLRPGDTDKLKKLLTTLELRYGIFLRSEQPDDSVLDFYESKLSDPAVSGEERVRTILVTEALRILREIAPARQKRKRK